MEGTGFEPVYAKRSDLQSDGFNHSPTPPRNVALGRKRSAGARRPGGLWWPGDSVSTPLRQSPVKNRAAGAVVVNEPAIRRETTVKEWSG